MAIAERELHDYLPVVDPAPDQLVGMISSSEVMRARRCPAPSGALSSRVAAAVYCFNVPKRRIPLP
jgi:hypothetical protein